MTKSTDTCSGNPGSCNRADIQQAHQRHDSLKWKYEYFRMQKKTLSLMKTTTFTLQHSLVLKEDNKIVNCSVANHTFCDITIFCDMTREFRWPKYFLCSILWFWLVSSLKEFGIVGKYVNFGDELNRFRHLLKSYILLSCRQET